jgi:hypothetical protein
MDEKSEAGQFGIFKNDVKNSDIAELLARAAEHAKQSLQRALRRASRRSFLWPEEAEEIYARGESLKVLSG